MDEHDNATCCQSVFSYPQRQGIAVVMATIGILGVFGNLLVIVAVTLSKRLRNPTNMFVFNLSIADLLISGFAVPVQVGALLVVDNTMPDRLCLFAVIVQFLSIGCSTNNLACIAISRYLILRCSKATYLKLFNRRRMSLAIALTWLIPACALVVQKISGDVKPGYEQGFSVCKWIQLKTSAEKIQSVLLWTFLPVQSFIICFCYSMVFYRIRTHTRRVQHLGGPIRVATVMGARHRWAGRRPAGYPYNHHHIKVTKNLFCVVCYFLVCFSAYILALGMQRPPAFTVVVAVLILGNSCINPLLYAAKHPQFKQVFRCIIRGRFAEIPGRVTFKCFNN